MRSELQPKVDRAKNVLVQGQQLSFLKVATHPHYFPFDLETVINPRYSGDESDIWKFQSAKKFIS